MSVTEENKTAKIGFISRLRAVSCLAIIVLHGFFIPVSLFSPETADRIVPMIIRNCMLWAVPCFVMVSGALLLDPQRSITIKDIFTKYIKRAFIALAVFSLLFVIFDAALNGSLEFTAIIKDWLYKLFTNRSWLHMWYLYMLIGMYLMLPVFRAAVSHMDGRLLRYTVILLFFFMSVIPTVNNLTGENAGFYIPVYTVYPFYFFLGYVMMQDEIRINKALAWILLILSTAAIIAVTYLGLAKDIESFRSLGNSYAFAAVAVQAAAVFAIAKGSTDRDNAGTRILYAIDKCSFGMYLLHVAALYTAYRVFKINPFEWGGVPLMAAIAAAAALVSFIVVYALRKLHIKL
ncbi:MAG: acyltransferase [Lachnospiraceae bacterium]|nr:acyltransferase [Lachnospiraceae bacterium]